MKKKILFIHHGKGWGGAPINMVNIIKYLDKSKYDIEVLLIKNSIVSSELSKRNINNFFLNSTFFRKYYSYYSHSEAENTVWYEFMRQPKKMLIWILSRYYFIPKVLRKIEFDIVHLNSAFLTDWLAPCAQKGKVVMHVQEPLKSGLIGIRSGFFIYQMNKYADWIIAISKDNANRIGLGHRTSVVYNFTDIQFSPPLNKHFLKKKKVLYVGGATSFKGFYTLVNSLDYLNQNISVIIAGYLDDIPKFKSAFLGIKYIHQIINPSIVKKYQAIEKIKNHENAEVIGFSNNISELLDHSEAIVSPFTKEHFSRPVIEAFAHKKPAIGSDVKGMEEIIDHEINGLIIKKNNPKELAEAINYICSNQVFAREMGENGYQKVLKLFSPKNTKQIEQIYNNLTG